MNGFEYQRQTARRQEILGHAHARRLDGSSIDTMTQELAAGIAALELQLERLGVAPVTRGHWQEQDAAALSRQAAEHQRVLSDLARSGADMVQLEAPPSRISEKP